MTNAGLIKALRNCGSTIGDCGLCLYKNHPMCHMKLMTDAADALEESLKPVVSVVPKFDSGNFFVQAILSYSDGTQVASKIVRIPRQLKDDKVQLPKEGEWIVEEEIDDSGFKWCKWRCSVCCEVVKKGWQHTKDGEKPKWKYCPNCGARMKGEKDA